MVNVLIPLIVDKEMALIPFGKHTTFSFLVLVYSTD